MEAELGFSFSVGKGERVRLEISRSRKERVVFPYSSLKLGKGIRLSFFLSDGLWFSVLFNVCVGLFFIYLFF